jgi:hypothetical protein
MYSSLAAAERHLSEKIFLIKSPIPQLPVSGLLILFRFMEPFSSYSLIFARFLPSRRHLTISVTLQTGSDVIIR